MAKQKQGRPPIDLGDRIRKLVTHTRALGPAAESPITHYRDAVNAAFNLIAYIERSLDDRQTYPSVRSKHLGLLHRFVLASLIESFERFIKELAAVCIDQLAPFVGDDRFEGFSANGNELIAHFDAGSIGKALCESETWLNHRRINERFRKLLQSTNGDLWNEFLFPGRGQRPVDQVESAATLAILWQVRHTLAHNSGVLTGSDAMKLRTLTGQVVGKERILAPTEADLRDVKRFLTETAEVTNRRVAERLSSLLTEIRTRDPLLFDAKDRARDLARTLQIPVTIDHQHAIP